MNEYVILRLVVGGISCIVSGFLFGCGDRGDMIPGRNWLKEKSTLDTAMPRTR